MTNISYSMHLHAGKVNYPSHDLDVCCSRPIARCYGIDNYEDILLHHPNEIEVALSLGHITEVLDEIHDICTVVH